MQPFDKHQANVGSLESCGGELVTAGATGLQNGSMTREAYQPAITNVGGSCAPLVQTASDPMNAAADRANESLIWAAVVSRFWGTQVEKFNQKVDEITAALAAQGPNYGVVVPMGPPSPGSPPDTSTEDIANAKAAAEAEAKRKWWEAHGTYVQDGGERAASMLQGGPTGANLSTARDAGALPPMAVDAWGMFVKGLQGKIDPVTDRGLPGLGLWGVGAASGPAGWLQSWGEKLKTGRFAPRDPVTGRFVSFKGTPWVEAVDSCSRRCQLGRQTRPVCGQRPIGQGRHSPQGRWRRPRIRFRRLGPVDT